MEHRMPPILGEMLHVTAQYAQEHTEELLERVNRENIAIIIQLEKGTVVMVPHWWYCKFHETVPG